MNNIHHQKQTGYLHPSIQTPNSHTDQHCSMYTVTREEK